VKAFFPFYVEYREILDVIPDLGLYGPCTCVTYGHYGEGKQTALELPEPVDLVLKRYGDGKQRCIAL